jgi:S1-C subfamily serine protease
MHELRHPSRLASSSESQSNAISRTCNYFLETLPWSNPPTRWSRFLITPHNSSNASPAAVAVDGGARWSASGIHWRSGVIVTAEEALERDEDIKMTLPGGRQVEASLAGRDPTTDVAVLRFQSDGLPIAQTADASLRPGQLVLAVGKCSARRARHRRACRWGLAQSSRRHDRQVDSS